jgi:hypothetical protein
MTADQHKQQDGKGEMEKGMHGDFVVEVDGWRNTPLNRRHKRRDVTPSVFYAGGTSSSTGRQTQVL